MLLLIDAADPVKAVPASPDMAPRKSNSTERLPKVNVGTFFSKPHAYILTFHS
jgi:hypothetical protein